MDPKIDLKTIIDLHVKWLRDEPGGNRANLWGANLLGANLQEADLQEADLLGANLRRANLQGANLRRANLQGANLQEANLLGANLQEADLLGANLRRANLQGANLQEADLLGANLRRANLQGANLRRANLQGANLQEANLQEANLLGANLQGANLQGATGAELAIAMVSHLPGGDLIAWKKCKGGVIVKLRIPESSRRSHGSERKCRAEYVTVLDVIGADEGVSHYDPEVVYRNGETVKADGWDEDRWNTCGHGIHFFITREEAEAYQL